MEENLFVLGKVRISNKDIFLEHISSLPIGYRIKISPLKETLKAKGCESSESSLERYIRFVNAQRKGWDIGIRIVSLGDACYQICERVEEKVPTIFGLWLFKCRQFINHRIERNQIK